MEESQEIEPLEDDYPKLEGAGMRMLRGLAEGDGGWRRLAGAIIGSLGGALIIAGSFFFTLERSSSGTEKAFIQYALSKPSLMLGVAIIVGILLAWWWRQSYAGCIVCLVGGGLLLYPLLGLVGPWVDCGFGAYIAYGGALLGITGGLIMLAERRSGLLAEVDYRDERISDLEGAVEALMGIWEEADKLDEARSRKEPFDSSDYDQAAAVAEKKLQDYHEEYEV